MGSKNIYLEDITKGFELISHLQKIPSDKKLIDEKLQELNKLIRQDYIELINQFQFREITNYQKDLFVLYNRLKEVVNSAILANKGVVAVGGRRNVGKSEFINSLLDINNLPTDIKATTAVPTYICFDKQEKIVAYNTYNLAIEIEQEALEAITCNFNDKYGISFTQLLKKIIIRVRNFKYKNLAFLDTPAIDINNCYIKKADYLIWVLDIEQEELLIEDIKFINQLDFSGGVFVLFNKAENKSIIEVKRILNRAKNNLGNLKNNLIGVSAYSAKLGKEVSTNKLVEFLTKINQQDNDVALTKEFRKVFTQLEKQYSQRINYSEEKLRQLKNLIKENKLNKKKRYLKRLLTNAKIEIELEEEFAKEIKSLMKQIIELVKSILTEVKISFFDYQKRGYKLLEAIKNDNFKLAKRLIDLGVDLEVKDGQGETPLILAIKKDANELKKELLLAGAELSYQGEKIIDDPIPGDGTKENPYIISALSGLEKIGGDDYPLGANYKLVRDIDASITQTKEYNNKQGWQPIGVSKELNNYEAFKGSFDGAGHTIKNLYSNRAEESQVGLFRVVGPGGVVKNLNLDGVEIFGKIEVGGIAGRVRLGEIVNCNFNGDIKGSKRVGQIVGKNEGGQIKSVSSCGKAIGQIDVGGLIGYNIYYGLLNNSFSTSEVKGEKRIGGLIGANDQGGQIEKSYASGDISGGSIAGGLGGYNYGSIKKSFASGDVTGIYQLGGLIGKNESKLGFGRADIIDCYSSGYIKGKKLIGGLVGVNKELIKESYATGRLDGDEILGGLVGYNSGQIEDSYVSREVNFKAQENTLVGKNFNGKIIDSYWKREYKD